jgi:hypothetical protein
LNGQSTQKTGSDSNKNFGGEVAAEEHFEDNSLKTAISDIQTDESLQKIEYKDSNKEDQPRDDDNDSLGGSDE